MNEARQRTRWSIPVGLFVTVLGFALWYLLLDDARMARTGIPAWTGVVLGTWATVTGYRGASGPLKAAAVVQWVLTGAFLCWMFWLSNLPETPAFDGLDVAPPVVLSDHLGREVSVAERLKSGPVHLVFYRGHW